MLRGAHFFFASHAAWELKKQLLQHLCCETYFFAILGVPVREVSQKMKFAFSCCVALVFFLASHAARELKKQLLRHLCGETRFYACLGVPVREVWQKLEFAFSCCAALVFFLLASHASCKLKKQLLRHRCIQSCHFQCSLTSSPHGQHSAIFKVVDEDYFLSS